MTDPVFPVPEPVLVPIADETGAVPVRRIFCAGRNYEEHAREMNAVVEREAPFFFIKGADTVVLSGATIPYPQGTSSLHHEMELGVVIGAEAAQIGIDDASSAIFGYCCALDLTRRDLQQVAKSKGLPWDFGKNFENGAVLSPIVPRARSGLVEAGAITLSVNGAARQSSDLSQMVWKIPELIAYLSRHYTLQPGDIVLTGTPAGVGAVGPGDRLEGSIEGVGQIELSIAPRPGA